MLIAFPSDGEVSSSRRDTHVRIQQSAPHAGEMTRHKARAMPKSNLLLAAGALIAGVLLVQHVRRYA